MSPFWTLWPAITSGALSVRAAELAEELLTRETLLEKDLERIFEGVIKQPERPLWRSDESLPVVEAASAPGGEPDDFHGSDDFWGYNH